MRIFRNTVAGGLLLMVAMGAATQGQVHAQHAAAPKKTIQIINGGTGSGFEFSPKSATVKVGTKVTWKNTTSAPHTITSKKSGLFNLGPINNGQSVSMVFKKAGTFKYFCSIHPDMTAKIVVK